MTDDDVVTIFICGVGDGISYNGSSSNKGPLLVILIFMLVGGADVSCTECLSVKGPMVNSISVVVVDVCDSVTGIVFISFSSVPSLLSRNSSVYCVIISSSFFCVMSFVGTLEYMVVVPSFVRIFPSTVGHFPSAALV